MRSSVTTMSNLSAATVLCLAFWYSMPAIAASPAPAPSELKALKTEIERLRGEIEGMRAELRQLNQRVGQPAAALAPTVRATVTTGAGAALGDDKAPLTLIEFSDYQCPYCRRFSQQTFPGIKKQYIDTGKLRYVFRDFPLDSIHPHARKAGEAAHCAGDQGKYWEAHELLFENQSALAVGSLKMYAEKINLNLDTFSDCLDKGKYKTRVEANAVDGQRAGVRGTPAFFSVRPARTDRLTACTSAARVRWTNFVGK